MSTSMVKLEASLDLLEELRARLANAGIDFDNPRPLDSAAEPLDAPISARKVVMGFAILTAALNTLTAGARLAEAVHDLVQEQHSQVVVIDPQTGDRIGIIDPAMDAATVRTIVTSVAESGGL